MGHGAIPVPAIVALVSISAVLAVANTQFLSVDNLQVIVDQAAIPIVIAVGLTFIVLMGSIDLSVEGIVAMGSMITSLLVMNDRNDMHLGLLAVPIAIAAGGILGLVAGTAVTRLRIPSFLATIATWYIALGIAQLLFGDKAKPRILDKDFLAWSQPQFLGLSGLVWLALAVVVFGIFLQQYTRFGRYAYAIGGSEEITKLSGIRVRRFRTVAFVFSGMCFALAGAMVTARTGVGAVAAGEGFLFLTISGVVIGGTLLIGGRGGVLHSVVGVLIMVVIANGMILAGVSPYLQQVVQGAVVLIAVIATVWRQRARLRVVL
jgi:ribose transport system permease protein